MSHPYANPNDRIRPIHAVVIGIVLMTLAGGSLLLSASNAPIAVDGAIDWQEGSALRAVVELLCLNFSYPTNYAGDVKIFILGVGSCLALLALGIATIVQSPTDVQGTLPDASTGPDDAVAGTQHKAHIHPLFAAQMLAGLYLLWSFTSSRWSSAPDLAIGASALLTISFLWSFAIGRGLSPASAKIATLGMLVVGVVTALIAIWYFYGRNPNLRAKFPFGNPTFLAAALIPAILIGTAYAVGAIAQTIRSRGAGSIGTGIICLLGAVVCAWAVYLTGGRGALVGLSIGALAAVFFALRGRQRWIPVVLAFFLVAGGSIYYKQTSGSSVDGDRVATAQLREFAWEYAWEMFSEHPLRGHGQAGFTLGGDTRAVDDVLDHPEVLEARIAHVHNEWLEVMADLGSVGLALIGATLLFTLVAGDGALAVSLSGPRKWMHIGLMGSLVGLMAEEAVGVGLRTGGLPVIFFSVMGLLWSLSRTDGGRSWIRPSSPPIWRLALGLVGIAAGLSSLALSRQDFAAAHHGFQANESFYSDDLDETIRLSEMATHRLNPQRVLTNLFRLSEAYLRAAEFLQARARDRQARANETDPPAPKLLALAVEDFQLSEAHCESGSGVLKRLLESSPGFINHGRLAHRFSQVRAYNAGVQGESELQVALMQNAAVAVERELQRQPFDASIAADWVGTVLTLPGAPPDLADVWTVLARPLRRSRTNRAYVDILRRLAPSEEFRRQLEPVTQAAYASLNEDEEDRHMGWRISWAPEKIRLTATIQFLFRDYAKAKEILQSIQPAYDHLAPQAPYGAAGYYAELAECTFFADRLNPAPAIDMANKAVALAPSSLLGRKLQNSIRSRLVDYHLSAGDEDMSSKLLESVLQQSTQQQGLQQELSRRYTRLGEFFLDTPISGEPDKKVTQSVTDRVLFCATRAVELSPANPDIHLEAANLLWRIGRDDASVDQVRQALTNGLAADTALEFLNYCLQVRPASQPLRDLRDAVVRSKVPSDLPAPPIPDDSNLPE